MAVQIREMSEKDWPEVSQIYQQGIETGLATMQPDCPSFAEWDQAHLKACRLAATEEEMVIGWAALTLVSGRCVYAGVAEVSVYIAPSHWRRGVGKLLLTQLVRLSEEEGFWTLQSSILRENAASIRLHEHCGFRMVGYREQIGRDRNGMWRDTVIMEKRSSRTKFGSSIVSSQT